jgi:CheY-like chemotaxis protein
MRAGKGEVVIRVRDNGMGIAPEKLTSVFDMFMRATRSSDPQHGGLGLGLTLVARLVELHGGRVEAHSEGLGKGSEFVVRLPLASNASAAAQSPRAEGAAIAQGHQRVLVVDDNADNAETLGALLQQAGHDVEVATSAAAALEVVREFRPDVMLVDISMPGMDGYELAKRVREGGLKDGALLVAMSGYGHEEAKKKARDAGFEDYLVKPVRIDELNRALARRQ